MKKLGLIFLILAAACVLFGGGTRAQEKIATPKETVKSPAPVMVDAAFIETLADYQMILREVERLEAATGTVEIPVSIAELRQRAGLKLAKLRAWMKEYGVGEDWSYDAARRSFLPPATATVSPAKGADRRP